jgi:hypothetical protein
MKYVALCLVVGFLGFLASAYVSYEAGINAVTGLDVVSANWPLVDRAKLQGEKWDYFAPAFLSTFGIGIALTLLAITVILYFKSRATA